MQLNPKIEDYRPWAWGLTIFAGATLTLAAMGNFQQITVTYDGQKYQVHHQFDKPTKQKGEVVAEVNSSFTSQKLICCGVAITSGIFAILSIHQEENVREAREYKIVKEAELIKMEIDTQMAAENKILGEKTLVATFELSQELLKNPVYLKLKQGMRNAELGEEEPQDDEDLWSTIDVSEGVTDAQLDEIKHRSKTEKLPKVITDITGCKQGTEAFNEVVQLLKKRFGNGGN